MKKVFLVLIIIFILFPNCKSPLKSLKGDSVSKRRQDTIMKIVGRLCGQWEVNEKIKQSYNSKGIGVGLMDIMCLVNIDNNQLLNELYITKYSGLSEIGAIIPNNMDSLYIHVADSVTISKRKKYYGFEYHNLKNISFIPIKELNDSFLMLVDGRKFQRIK